MIILLYVLIVGLAWNISLIETLQGLICFIVAVSSSANIFAGNDSKANILSGIAFNYYWKNHLQITVM